MLDFEWHIFDEFKIQHYLSNICSYFLHIIIVFYHLQ